MRCGELDGTQDTPTLAGWRIGVSVPSEQGILAHTPQPDYKVCLKMQPQAFSSAWLGNACWICHIWALSLASSSSMSIVARGDCSKYIVSYGCEIPGVVLRTNPCRLQWQSLIFHSWASAVS